MSEEMSKHYGPTYSRNIVTLVDVTLPLTSQQNTGPKAAHLSMFPRRNSMPCRQAGPSAGWNTVTADLVRTKPKQNSFLQSYPRLYSLKNLPKNESGCMKNCPPRKSKYQNIWTEVYKTYRAGMLELLLTTTPFDSGRHSQMNNAVSSGNLRCHSGDDTSSLWSGGARSFASEKPMPKFWTGQDWDRKVRTALDSELSSTYQAGVP
ncbi:hypothetical protein BDR07DRAFT_1381241 [Suillus spraguei]|nr:hypothetical protein BDR07DRAFT_1381241 [Suillus spraguei]